MGSEKKSAEEIIGDFKKALDDIVKEEPRRKEEIARKREEEAKKIQKYKDLMNLNADLDKFSLPLSEREVILNIFHKFSCFLEKIA